MRSILYPFTLSVLIAVCPLEKSFSQTTFPGDSIKAILVKDWERAKAYTADYMKAMPADKYSLKANDSVRTFAQQLLHIVQANAFLVSLAKGESPNFSGRQLERIQSAQSADSVMYFVNHSYDDAIEALKKTTTGDLMKTNTFTMDKPYTATRLSWFMKAFEHQTHHRGQTTIYLRDAGVKPPDERLF
ncbi:damage-inducible protein DinB [Segetibacter sp. 3557_3]|uniref:DinB family protein n=1 Tax=Segetibacter sp. 3557_3 TaxID=2547429 RepID=UPI0010590AD9|nr:DinB family protein [Segetibacter sp. 3557_3]TDH19700.1 damage-inducible protein DinB [Segetibacter sp. 3557_3]